MDNLGEDFEGSLLI